MTRGRVIPIDRKSSSGAAHAVSGLPHVVIIGAGPAGIAAAVCASLYEAPVTLVDDNPSVGGQIWRGADASNEWFRRLSETNTRVITGARVLSGDASQQTLLVERAGQAQTISYDRLILATGARELFLPFPGWTLPNVMGVGGLQALVKSGMPVSGKRIIVSGSGPLLLAVASYLVSKGAIVPLVAEQVGFGSSAKFAAGLLRHPDKLRQARTLLPPRYLTNCWIEAAHGSERVESVHLRRGNRVWEEPCDYVANSYGFVSNTELAAQLGCEMENGAVKLTYPFHETSVENISCIGEAAGVGGVDTAICEGQIAGHAAVTDDFPTGLLRKWQKAENFAHSLNQTFKPRPELRALAQPDTIVCRCEDVPLSRLRSCDSWRSAKLHERCGMGPCQGRICGPAVQFILGWEPTSVRPPIFPARLDTLIEENSAT